MLAMRYYQNVSRICLWSSWEKLRHVLTKIVDDMAERCDRIEAELLMRDAASSGTSKSSLEEKREE